MNNVVSSILGIIGSIIYLMLIFIISGMLVIAIISYFKKYTKHELTHEVLVDSIQCKDGIVVYKTTNNHNFTYTTIFCTGEENE